MVHMKVCKVKVRSARSGLGCSAPAYNPLFRTRSVEANVVLSVCTVHRARVAYDVLGKVGGAVARLDDWLPNQPENNQELFSLTDLKT